MSSITFLAVGDTARSTFTCICFRDFSSFEINLKRF